MTSRLVFAVGVGAVLAAWAIARFRAHRVRRALVAALSSTNPRVRAAAIRVMAQEGLHRYARPLLDVATDDPEPTVRAELADAVRRQRWQPTDARAVAELRLWSELSFRGQARP
ncbi:MAG TPA: HEAT repeat domain-containing protein [Mycobacteriales bacterium]|nr:HEAT repeat domain-containing protein [Mycobacteriales bacterium]